MSNREKKQSFLGGAAILAAAVAIVKIIGAIYKIPLGNIIGDEGKAHFTVAYNIYNLLLTISTAGLPLAISKLTSEAHALGRENEKRKIFRTAIWLFFGLGLVFSQGATSGGTDIIGKLLKLKFPWLPTGKLVMVPDMAVVVLAALVFGTVNAALYGLIQMYLLAKVMDGVLYGWDTSRVAYIITDRWEETARGLLDMERGVTLLQGRGAYTGAEKQVLLVAFKQKEIVPIKRMLREIDPQAFFIVCDAHEVLGEGFGDYQKEEI